MKKHLLTKMLLVAAMLGLGTSAWAGISTLYSQDYESSIDASSWVTQNLAPTLETGDAVYGKFIQMSVGNNNSRSTYTTWGNSFYGDHTTYTLEFDANITVTTTNTKNQSSNLAIMADGYTLPNANYNYASTYLFKIANEANTTTFTVNDSETKFTMPVGVWCHYTIVVDNSDRTAVYTITNKETSSQVVTGTYNLPEGTSYKAVGMYYLSGRYWSVGKFDNISISTEVNEEVVSAPTIAVDYAGANRTVTITSGESSESNVVTTYYTLNGDDPTSSSSVYSTPLDIDEDCTVKAITISSTSIASSIASQEVTVGQLKLVTPTFTKTGYSDGSYIVEMSSNQTGLAYPPASTTLYYSIDGGAATEYSSAISVTAGSTVTGYATATNYTNSDDANLTTAVRPVLSEVWSIDFAGQATEDKGEVTVGDAAFTANGVDFGNISGSFTSNDNFGVKTGSTWLLRHNSRGLYSMNGSGTPVGVAGLTEGQYVKIVVSGMDTRSVSGAASLVDDMSTTTELYIVANEDGDACINFNRYVFIKSIAVCNVVSSVSATIGTTGYTSFASSYPLNISGMTTSEGTIEAYYVEESGVKNSYISFTASPDNVAAGTGLILKGDAGATVTIPVAASGTDLSATNKLVGCPTATTITSGTANYENIYVLGASKAEFQNIKNWIDTNSSLEIPAGKAYLDATGVSTAPTLTFNFGGESTGISEMRNAQSAMSNEVYNLNGQRVAQPTKGLYITNGRKVVVK